jgi:serine/threonine-protein kinase
MVMASFPFLCPFEYHSWGCVVSRGLAGPLLDARQAADILAGEEPLIGRSIGNYKIVRIIGEGGMGTVYLAEHPMIGKRVAVKMLRPELGTNPGLVSRFFQEARAVNEIRHPNIVDISDFGKTEDGIVYLVMELLEGRSLRDRLNAEGALPIEDVVTICGQVCDALAAAHRGGIVHRDLKPDNIFLLQDPAQPGVLRSKLYDFGVAKLLGEQDTKVSHKTIAGSVVGTPYYMSPEQALCQDVGAAADIYAMGVVMFEMVTGEVPFKAEQLVLLLNAILKQPAPPASQFRHEVPPFLDRLILRCLEKDPGARPQTMEEIVALLGAGAAELDGQSIALGETMAAGPGLAAAPRSTAARPTVMTARTSTPRSRTTAIPQSALARTSEAAPAMQTAIPRDGASEGAPAGRRGSARQGGAGLGGLARAWLNSPRVVRAAVPLAVVAAAVIVASVFISTASAPSITHEIVAEQPPPLPAPSHAALTLNSDPVGAEVTRLNDGRLLGTTPLVDIRPVDGQQIIYRFRLAGYTEVQMPFQVATGGSFEVKASLEPKPREPSRSASPGSSRRTSRGKLRKGEPEARPAPAAPAPAPVAQPHYDAASSSTLPPLNPSVRVRRIGGR